MCYMRIYLRNGQVGMRHKEGNTANHRLDEAIQHQILEQAVGDHDAAPGLSNERAHHCKHQKWHFILRVYTTVSFLKGGTTS